MRLEPCECMSSEHCATLGETKVEPMALHGFRLMVLHEYSWHSTSAHPRAVSKHFSHHPSQSSSDKNRYHTSHHAPRETRPEPQDSSRCSAAIETTLPERGETSAATCSLVVQVIHMTSGASIINGQTSSYATLMSKFSPSDWM